MEIRNKLDSQKGRKFIHCGCRMFEEIFPNNNRIEFIRTCMTIHFSSIFFLLSKYIIIKMIIYIVAFFDVFNASKNYCWGILIKYSFSAIVIFQSFPHVLFMFLTS